MLLKWRLMIWCVHSSQLLLLYLHSLPSPPPPLPRPAPPPSTVQGPRAPFPMVSLPGGLMPTSHEAKSQGQVRHAHVDTRGLRV